MAKDTTTSYYAVSLESGSRIVPYNVSTVGNVFFGVNLTMKLNVKRDPLPNVWTRNAFLQSGIWTCGE